MCLSLETLSSIIRNASPILVELMDLVNSNFSVLNDLTQMVNFPTPIHTVTFTVLLFWTYFFSALTRKLQLGLSGPNWESECSKHAQVSAPNWSWGFWRCSEPLQ